MTDRKQLLVGWVLLTLGVLGMVSGFVMFALAIWTHSADQDHRLAGFGALLFCPGVALTFSGSMVVFT